MITIDLNSDLGEEVGDDGAMFEIVTSANIACGFHAGSDATMAAAASMARANQVNLGAHPSYRDREGFGRRDQVINVDTLRLDIFEQVVALSTAAELADARVRYLKPHGALYNRIAIDPVQADAVALVARDTTLPILGLAGTSIHKAAERYGVQFFREAFVDRAYQSDGTLVPRTAAGAVLTDPIAMAARAVRMVTGGEVEAVDGTMLRIELDSLCVHGDTPGAVAMAQEVRKQLEAEGIEIRPFV
ncbi:MAG: 5-oxoprolinase subunit PxpA [Terrimesophilobacter sp.]